MSTQKEKIMEQQANERLQAQLKAEREIREKEAEKIRLKLQQEREEAERIAAAERKQLLSQIPDLEKRFNAMNQQMKASEQKLGDVATNIGIASANLDKTRRDLVQLRDYHAQLEQSLTDLRKDEKALSDRISTFSSHIKIVEEKSSELLKQWSVLLDEADKANRLSKDTVAQLKGIENDLNASVQLLKNTYSVIEKTESKINEYRKNASDLEERYRSAATEVNLLRDSSAVGTAAFIEMQTLYKQGYELRGIKSDEEINMWFEEINGKHKVAIKMRNMVENKGILWLKELDLTGFDKSSENDFIQDHKDFLDEYGVTLKNGKPRKFPRNPPPGTIKEWEKVVIKNQNKA